MVVRVYKPDNGRDPACFFCYFLEGAQVVLDELRLEQEVLGGVTGQGKLIVQYNYLPVGSSTWPWRANNSTNFGATWTARTIYPPPNSFDNYVDANKRDSCIALVMRAVGGYSLYYVRSTNSGVTWQDTMKVPQAVSGTMPDYPKMDIRGPYILIGYYDAGGGGGRIGYVRSTNWGTTWNTVRTWVSTATGQGNCPRFSPAPSNNAYFMWGQPASWQPTTIWFSRSTDLGATWNAPTQVLAVNMSSHLPSMRPTHTFPVLDVAPNGNLYYTIMHMMQGTGWDIAFVKSTNQGTTWSAPVRINNDVSTPNADQYCNWTEVDYRGYIHVFWYDNRNYPSNIYASDLYYSYSTNEGVTWSANERINDVTPLSTTSADLSRMGDFQMIDTDSTRVYCQWTQVNPQHTAAFVNTSSRILPSGVEEKPTGNPWVTRRVEGVELARSRPNPVMNGAELAFQLERSGEASLRVYDLSGKLVRTLVNGSLPAGSHSAKWDTRDHSGNRVPSGVYFYRLESGGLTTTKELVVAR